jgi:hypothetical protein
MEDIKKLINYFREFETNEALKKIDLNTNSTLVFKLNIKQDDLNNYKTLVEKVNKFKLARIKDILKNIKFKSENYSKTIVKKISPKINENLNIFDLKNLIDENKFSTQSQCNKTLIDIVNIINNKDFILMYPVLNWNYNSKLMQFPLLVFNCSLLTDKYKINNYNIQAPALEAILKDICKFDKDSLDSMKSENSTFIKSLELLA